MTKIVPSINELVPFRELAPGQGCRGSRTAALSIFRFSGSSANRKSKMVKKMGSDLIS